MTFSGRLQCVWLIFISIFSKWMEQSHQIQLLLSFKFDGRGLAIPTGTLKGRQNETKKEMESHCVELYVRCFLLWTTGRYVWFTKQLLALLHDVLADIFCSIPFHPIENAAGTPLKWFKNPIISYKPQFEKLEVGDGWVKSVSGLAMLNRDREMLLSSWREQNVSSQPYMTCPYISVTFGSSLPSTHDTQELSYTKLALLMPHLPRWPIISFGLGEQIWGG